jgi:triacylglycerol lipase
MNLALKFPAWLYRFASLFVDLFAELRGDWYANFFQSSRQLSEKSCAAFNRSCPDKNGVYYQSYSSALRFFFGDPLYFFTWLLVRILDGPNDGLCPAASAIWGNFRGTLTGRRLFGVSHGGILDLYRFPFRGVRLIIPSGGSPLPLVQRAPFKMPELYVSIVKELAEKGL